MKRQSKYGKGYEDGYCAGWLKAWNAQADSKRTCHKSESHDFDMDITPTSFDCCGFVVNDIADDMNYCPNCGAMVVD